VEKFVLDANVFITAHRDNYPFDVVPGFWEALDFHHDRKRVFSIDRVKKELAGVGDRLKQWSEDSVQASFWKRTADKAVIDQYRAMVRWVAKEPQFTDESREEFANVADGWLVAYAKANRLSVVTLEVVGRGAKIKIPNVCEAFDVEYVNTVELLRRLGVRLDLRKRTK
jgi:hypothetical protein